MIRIWAASDVVSRIIALCISSRIVVKLPLLQSWAVDTCVS